MVNATITPSPSPFFVAGTLDDAFSLQDEVRQLKENIAIIQREADRRQAQITNIVHEHLQAGTWQEGRLFIREKPGRRSLDLAAFEQEHPEEYRQVVTMKPHATIADAEKVLSDEAVDAICHRAASTYEIDVLIPGGV